LGVIRQSDQGGKKKIDSFVRVRGPKEGKIGPKGSGC